MSDDPKDPVTAAAEELAKQLPVPQVYEEGLLVPVLASWGAFILIVSGGRIGHPSVIEYHRPLPRNRRLLGVATLALFAVTFIGVPFG